MVRLGRPVSTSLNARWVIRCSRSSILPTISLKLVASRASSSLAAHLDLDVLARGQPPGRLVEPGQRLGDAPGGLPRAERRPTAGRAR